jgi:hypothetical protein
MKYDNFNIMRLALTSDPKDGLYSYNRKYNSPVKAAGSAWLSNRFLCNTWFQTGRSLHQNLTKRNHILIFLLAINVKK